MKTGSKKGVIGRAISRARAIAGKESSCGSARATELRRVWAKAAAQWSRKAMGFAEKASEFLWAWSISREGKEIAAATARSLTALGEKRTTAADKTDIKEGKMEGTKLQ
jgi:hypothetical protein